MASTDVRSAEALSGANGTPEPKAVAEAQRGQGFGPFVLLKLLGSDSLTLTYKASHRPSGETLVVRMLRPEIAREGGACADTFLREAETAQAMKHPGIQRILRHGVLEGRPYYVAEYVAGLSLQRVLARRATLDIAFGLELAIQIAEALEYGHARGLCHQALSPAAIVITPQRRAKLVGYGVGHAPLRDLQELVVRRTRIGFYLAPEQLVSGGHADARTDIYSLGAILYHALAGRPPFCGSSEDSAYLSLSEEEITDPLVLNPALSPALSRLIRSMINLEPDRRYQTAARLLKDLRALSVEASEAADKTRGFLKVAKKSHRIPEQAGCSRKLVRRLRHPHARPAHRSGTCKKMQAQRERLAVVGALVLAVVLAALFVAVVC